MVRTLFINDLQTRFTNHLPTGRQAIHAFVLGFMIRNGLFCFLPLTPDALRLTIES